jgi:hypothetical protein
VPWAITIGLSRITLVFGAFGRLAVVTASTRMTQMADLNAA